MINKVILVLILTFIFIEGLHVRYHQKQDCNGTVTTNT